MPTANEYLEIRSQIDTVVLILMVTTLLGVWGGSKLRFVRSAFQIINKPSHDRPIPLWIVMLLSGLFRLPNMGTSLWYDETFSWNVASLPFAELHTLIMADVHPPLPYLIQWLQIRLIGSSEFALRTPALVFGVASVYLMYRLSRGMGLGRMVALGAATLTALAPMHVWYSNEARGYTLLLCGVLISMITIVEKKPHWFMLTGLLPWIHAHGMIYAGVLGITALIYYPRPKWMFPVGVAGFVSALWLPFMLYQSGDVADGFWLHPLNLGGMLQFFIAPTIGYQYPDVITFPVLMMVIGFSGVALWSNRRWLTTQWGKLWLVVFGGVPLLTGIISHVWHPVFLYRALIPSAMLIIILWSKTLLSHKYRFAWARLFVPMMGLLLMMSYLPAFHKQDLRGAFNLCDSIGPVYTLSTSTALIARYYSDRPQFVWYNSNDHHQHLTPEAMDTLRFMHMGFPNIHTPFCIPFANTPYITSAQAQHLEDIFARFSHRVHSITVDDYYEFIVYEMNHD